MGKQDFIFIAITQTVRLREINEHGYFFWFKKQYKVCDLYTYSKICLTVCYFLFGLAVFSSMIYYKIIKCNVCTEIFYKQMLIMFVLLCMYFQHLYYFSFRHGLWQPKLQKQIESVSWLGHNHFVQRIRYCYFSFQVCTALKIKRF